ncbi:ABC transporter ATP-binding protein [Pseudoclavibacter alba]|nr:ABC transporter ATP-binding protein [Pseudoclavibacter alba]
MNTQPAHATHQPPHGAAMPAAAASHTTPNHTAARLRDVVKRYGQPGRNEVFALAGVSLDIPQGEFTAVMGPSGSGKSTLMHCMAGLDTPTSGLVQLGNRDITQLGDKDLTELRRREIGFIFQAFNLIPTLTAKENIELPFALDGRKPSAEEQQWIGQLAQVLGLTERLGHRPNELSGGQQQRVAIARALATRPRIVIADEPTGNLDSRSGAEVLRLLRNAASQTGQTIVMVTHDPYAASIADRVVFLADGKISRQERGLTPQQISEIMLHDSDVQPGTAVQGGAR